MSEVVDARGLACPQPVIQTRTAMQRAEQAAAQVVTLVDNETAVTNVSRMAAKAGWQVEVIPEGDEFRIEMIRGASSPRGEGAPSAEAMPQAASQPAGALAVGRAEALSGPLVLVVSSDIMGRGEAELGEILIRGFFHTLGEVAPRPQTILFFNTGVRLACAGSPVLDDLCALEAEDVEMLVCGTCLGYLALTDELAVGQVSNMYDIAETMLRAAKVIHL